MRKTVSVLGHFAEGKNLLNGQTIKTKIVTEELQHQIGEDQVLKIDTHGGWKTLLKAPFDTYRALKSSTNVLIFPAHNGLRVYAPLLVFLRTFFRNRGLHYAVIGGWLPHFLKKRRALTKHLKKFDGIYVETNSMKKSLEAQGFSNVFVMPNCKKLTVLSKDNLVFPKGIPYKLCTFSRVMKEKGIEDAVKAVLSVNESLGYEAFNLDIYGQVDSSQEEWFSDFQKTFPSSIRYEGLIHFDQSVTVLKDYFALLFPTHYEGEGFAGTLIDAFSAGVPVVASDWKYNSEIVSKDVGYLYPTGDQAGLESILKQAAKNPTFFNAKRTSCLQVAEQYRIDKIVSILVKCLTSQNNL